MKMPLPAVMGVLLLLGTVSTASAAQLEALIDPYADSSGFEITYQQTVIIGHNDGGDLIDAMNGQSWNVTLSAPPGSTDSQRIMEQLNQNMIAQESIVQVDNLNVDYTAQMRSNIKSISIDYKIKLDGNITGYVIGDSYDPALVDMSWRGISIHDPVTIQGQEINMPLSVIRSQNPMLASLMEGSDAESLLKIPLMDGSFVLEQILDNWHFLFDPTGINVDSSQYGLSDELAGHVVSSFTMGESSIREGIQIEQIETASFMAEKEYEVRTVQSADIGNIDVLGFANRDRVDGVELLGVYPEAPPGFGTGAAGDFSVFIIYGMAGMAAAGGGAFFLYSNRQMKKEMGQGQSGIDPSRLVGYQTSASSGGYQTNRGEAQLADDSSYQKTRSVYETEYVQNEQQTEKHQQVQWEAACGCAASAEMGNECDCAMQSSCLCDADCRCNMDVCSEHTTSF